MRQTTPTPLLSEKEKLAPMAYSDGIAVASKEPSCTCDQDWSGSELATIYGGGNRAHAKGAVGEAKCFAAPMLVQITPLPGTLNDWYYRNAQNPPQVTAVSERRKVSASDCAVQIRGLDKCSGERWMATTQRNMVAGAMDTLKAEDALPAINCSAGVSKSNITTQCTSGHACGGFDIKRDLVLHRLLPLPLVVIRGSCIHA